MLLLAFSDAICGLGCNSTFVFSDSNTNSWTPLDATTCCVSGTNPSADAAVTNAKGGSTTITSTVSNPGADDNLSTNLIVVEVTNVSTVQAHSGGSGITWQTAGSPTSLPGATAGTSSVILGMAESSTSPANELTSGAGFSIFSSSAVTNGGSQPTSWRSSRKGMGHRAHSRRTIVGSQQPTNGNAFTVALTYTGPISGPAKPFFRADYYQDHSWLPPLVGNSGKCLGTADGISVSFLTCGSSSGGDTITSPNSTLGVGGTSTNTTLDVLGAAGKIFAGATPALTYNPILGVDGSSPGTLQLANGSSPFHVIIGSGATANWTFKLPATGGVNQYVLETDGSGNTSWVAQNTSGDSITSPNSTISVGGTSIATTIDVAGTIPLVRFSLVPRLHSRMRHSLG